VTTSPIDSQGVEWNPELHTANQSKNTDGTWRRKRKEKGESASAPKAVMLPTAPPPPPAATTQPTVEPVATVPPAPAPTAPAVPAVPVVPPAPPASTVASSDEKKVTTFIELVRYVTNLVGTKQIFQMDILAACAEVGVPDIHSCAKPENVALIPAVAESIRKRLQK
jgi:hypothetical protein